jgi:predicted type IV restriction endonuclease
VYPILVRERIRRVIELCDALTKDLASPQTKTDTAAKEHLYKAAWSLCFHLKSR